MTPAIIGFAEKKNKRHLEDGADTNTYLRDAVAAALRDSGIALAEVDGFGLISFSLEPDHAVDVAWRLGMSLRWIDQATHGGASGVNMLGHALRAIEAGDAKVIVVVAGDAPVVIRAIGQCYNYDNQDGSGLRTGLSTVADELWNAAGVGPQDMDLACAYDDYPAMVYAQLNDLKLIPGEDIKRFAREKIADRSFPVNTSGGLLSAGQAGGAGGMLGTIEVIRQLQHRAGERQIPKARFGVATGYGQVLYRYGAASGAAVLERKA